MTKRIHILHIVPMLRAGGMELALSRVVNGLGKEGFTHAVVALKGDAEIRDRFGPGVSIHCIHAHPRDPFVPLRLWRLILRENPTVIHARNIGAWPEVAVARLATLPTIPLVFSFHGLAEAKPIPLRWRVVCQVLARITTQMFTVSQGSRRFLEDQLGLPQGRVGVIPNGVDTERFSPGPPMPTSTSQGLVVGTLGHLLPVKNQALLVMACHRLLQGGTDLRLDIAGEGPERGALEGLVRSLGIAERVRLVGQVADPPGFLRSLDVFVLPSDGEAHPNALSEAMACGLPCLATRVGGVAEIVDDGRAGWLFDPGDLEGLVTRLGALLADAQTRATLGAAARRRTCETYSMDTMLDRYRALYLGLAGRA